MSAQGWIQRKILVNNKKDRFSVFCFFYLHCFVASGKVWLHNTVPFACDTLQILSNAPAFSLSPWTLFSLCPIQQDVGYFTGHQPRNRERMEIPCMDITKTHCRTNLCFSPVFYLLYSPFVPKKDIFVPWGMTILMSRDEILIERRGERDSWHAAGCTERIRHSYMFVTCLKGMFNSV